MPDRRLVERMRGFGTTIFAEMSALAMLTDSVNLGQGFPDTDGPDELLEAAVEAIRSGHNQYPPGPGIPSCGRRSLPTSGGTTGSSYDPDAEVLVTAGRDRGGRGEPARARRPRGRGRRVRALLRLLRREHRARRRHPPRLSRCAATATRRSLRRAGFDPAELRAAIGRRTKAILLNTPHNPTGKVFGAEELDAVAGLATRARPRRDRRRGLRAPDLRRTRARAVATLPRAWPNAR